MSINEKWLKDDSDVAAITIREYLQSAGGEDDVIFPPTFKNPEGKYAIDNTETGNVCIIDTVGSQANRIEPLFKEPPYASWVPQVRIKAGTQTINLLDVGHRIADAFVRFSDLPDPIDIESAFLEHDRGNSLKLAELAPTSLIFGAWDSRGTQVKVPRVFSSTIRAFNVDTLHRSAQYVPPIDYQEEGFISENEMEKKDNEKSPVAKVGLVHVPARGLGGILVRGHIRRDAVLNLSTIRNYSVRDDKNELDIDKTEKLRAYLLGLTLCAAFVPLRQNLRQGCLLVRHPEKEPEVHLVSYLGKREVFVPDLSKIIKFTKNAAKDFGTTDKTIEGMFNRAKAREAVKKAGGKKK
ncbi:MAG: type I-U CRISPR-associated protein Cas7 [Deltaproteobacteria bacterium]|nr:type I-U CRISPR-associated protein Cas7 [Deltaproteobacteria bacterium]